MSRILVVGGYGGFGARLSKRLANSGHEVLVGGRSLARATAFCAKAGIGVPVMIDRSDAPGRVIAQTSPDIVIDAAGPFQESGYELPEACIDAGCHYLDLGDDRDFVTGIADLDDRARRRGIAVISGASSVPALSHAVVFELAQGLSRIDAIEIAISASSRASAGDSVATAILAGVGQPLRVWQGKRWVRRFGWQRLRRERFALPSGKSLQPRLVALADVPDLELLPKRMAAVSAVTFHAGTESTVANLGLWVASWMVRWQLVKSLASAKRILVPLHRLTRLWGSDRSGMVVRLFGRANGRRVERRWTIIAEHGVGPEIPVMAATILADRIHTLSTGARHAGGLLSLADFAASFQGLAIDQATAELPQADALYARTMGSSFDRLDPAVRAIHDVLRDHGASGQANVARGSNPFARLIAGSMRFPPAGDYPLHVHFEERDGVERWTREFGCHSFHSHMRAGQQGEVIERFGLLRFYFRLLEAGGALTMDLRRWSIGALPMPRALGPKTSAREWEENGLFAFDVAVALPIIGQIVRYQGQLRP